jgi:hypothetical protein
LENKKIHLVITYIDCETKKSPSRYEGVYDLSECLVHRSFYIGRTKTLGVPLWFDSEQAAMAYVEKSHEEAEHEFCLIQEIYPDNRFFAHSARIIFTGKSKEVFIMDEYKQKNSPNLWESGRIYSICDKAAAEDYVRRFNEDAKAAHKAFCKA